MFDPKISAGDEFGHARERGPFQFEVDQPVGVRQQALAEDRHQRERQHIASSIADGDASRTRPRIAKGICEGRGVERIEYQVSASFRRVAHSGGVIVRSQRDALVGNSVVDERLKLGLVTPDGDDPTRAQQPRGLRCGLAYRACRS